MVSFFNCRGVLGVLCPVSLRLGWQAAEATWSPMTVAWWLDDERGGRVRVFVELSPEHPPTVLPRACLEDNTCGYSCPNGSTLLLAGAGILGTKVGGVLIFRA